MNGRKLQYKDLESRISILLIDAICHLIIKRPPLNVLLKINIGKIKITGVSAFHDFLKHKPIAAIHIYSQWCS